MCTLGQHFQCSNKFGTCNIICWNSESNAFYMHVSYKKTTWFSYLQADISCLSIFDYLWYEEARAELQPTSNTQTQTLRMCAIQTDFLQLPAHNKRGQNSGMVSVNYNNLDVYHKIYLNICNIFPEKDKRYNERKQNPVHCGPISAVHQTRLNSASLSLLITLFLCHVWLSMKENNDSLWRRERCCHSTSSSHFQFLFLFIALLFMHRNISILLRSITPS